MTDRSKLLLDRSQPDPGEPVRVDVRHGAEHQKLQCELALIVAVADNDDGSSSSFQVLVGDASAHAHKAIAAAMHVGQSLGILDAVLAVELAKDYEGTAAAIGHALVMHSRWKEAQDGKAERGPRDDAGDEDGPRPRGP